MAYQPKSYRKFAATAATATLVATAVTPAFAAENLPFGDVNQNYAEAVGALYSKGIVNGVSKTEFGTYQSLKRGDAAVIIARALELDTKNAPDAGFKDVNSNIKGAVNALVAKGIINGVSKDKFDPDAPLTRGAMAKILVNAYNLKDYAKETPFTDLTSTFKPYVEALYGAGITKGKGSTYGTNEKITRGDFANMLYKAMNIEAPKAESIKAIDDITVDEGTKLEDVKLPEKVTVVYSDKSEKEASVKWDTSKLDTSKPDTYKLEGTVDGTDLKASVNVVVKAVAPKVESVSAITTNSVKVVFNKEIEGLTADDVTVTNKGTGQKQYVKSVTLSADKKSATVEFYDKLANNNTYSFEIKSGDNTLTYDFGYVATDVAKIEIANQTVKKGDKISFKVYDANGIDITNDVSSNLKIVSPSGLITDDGTVNLTPGTSTTVKVVYTNPTTNLKVESDTVTVTATDAEPASISTYTVDSSQPNWDAADFKQNETIDTATTNKRIYVRLLDQFGKDYTLTGSEKLVFESLNTDVAVVDKTTGVITPMGEGIAPVKVSVVKTVDGKEVEEISKTVSVKVIAPPVATGLTLNTSNVTVSTQDTVGVTVTGKVVDQYGNPVVGVTPTVSDADSNGNDNVNLVDATATPTDNNGEFSFVVKPDTTKAQAGTYTVNVSVTVGTKTIKVPLTVTLKAPGSFYGYQVRGLVDTLDKKSGATNGSMDISVVSVDNAGLVIEEEPTDNVTVTVTDKDGNVVAGAVTGTTVNASALTAGETYTVTVKLGNKVIKTQPVSVVDTTVKSIPKFTSSNLVIDTTNSGTLADSLAAIIDVKLGSSIAKSDTVTGLTFVSSDDTVIDDTKTDTTNTLAPGTATIFVKSISYNYDIDGNPATTDDAGTETVNFDTPVKLTVNVK